MGTEENRKARRYKRHKGAVNGIKRHREGQRKGEGWEEV